MNQMLPTLLSLADAAKELCQSTSGRKITVTTLRKEIRRGRLRHRSIGGKHYVDYPAIKEWLDTCLVKESRPASSSASEAVAIKSTSSRTATQRSALDAALSAAHKLKGLSGNTSSAG